MKINIPYFNILCTVTWVLACVVISNSGLGVFAKIFWLGLATVVYPIIMLYDIEISVELNLKKVKGENSTNE